MPDENGDGKGGPVIMPSERRGMTGLGSFGKPAVLINRLQRIMARYEKCSSKGDRVPDGTWSGQTVQPLIERLIVQLQAGPRYSTAGTPRVAGFYFYRKGGEITIRMLTKDSALRCCRTWVEGMVPLTSAAAPVAKNR